MTTQKDSKKRTRDLFMKYGIGTKNTKKDHCRVGTNTVLKNPTLLPRYVETKLYEKEAVVRNTNRTTSVL